MTELPTERRPIDWLNRGIGLLAAVAVPFVVAALFQVISDGEVVVGVVVVIGVLLLLRPGRIRAAGIGWLVGCALYAGFTAWLIWQLGDALS